jgi:hypothetical protein
MPGSTGCPAGDAAEIRSLGPALSRRRTESFARHTIDASNGPTAGFTR